MFVITVAYFFCIRNGVCLCQLRVYGVNFNSLLWETMIVNNNVYTYSVDLGIFPFDLELKLQLQFHTSWLTISE